MFTLTLTDRNGTPLNEGDIVKISNSGKFTFFSEVKYLEKEKVITPFHTFTFHSFEKVDKVPDSAIKSSEERYDIWFLGNEASPDHKAADYEGYLMEWRKCERNLEKRCWRIERKKAA